MKYIYSLGGSSQEKPAAVMLVGDSGIVLGYSQSIELPSAEQLASGEPFELNAGRTMLDATSFSSDIDAVMPDLSSYPFTLVIRIGDRREIRLADCLLLNRDGFTLHPNDRFVEVEPATIRIPRQA